ncbi:hypothetical protein IX27_00290 [Streptomyces sp. JS01]|uniref:hypothetical protein n=1 Tax=Streptomyces sp. JS01 TaxID=1525753 RepID=UPI00050597D4|nr:hypothetical protein [Streptomyces sp. JS01]KFK91506.1 hypothetical protein IX27_00290 [Streptomyces sp. JS01]
MSDIEKAAEDAVEAAANSQQLALIAAALQAQQLTQRPPAPAPVAAPSGGAAKWIGIGMGGSIFLVAFALSAIAVAISAVALTGCVLILRSVWRDVQRGR